MLSFPAAVLALLLAGVVLLLGLWGSHGYQPSRPQLTLNPRPPALPPFFAGEATSGAGYPLKKRLSPG